MKKLLGYLLFVFVLFSCLQANALAQSTDVISEFKSNITLEQNTDIKVRKKLHTSSHTQDMASTEIFQQNIVFNLHSLDQ